MFFKSLIAIFSLICAINAQQNDNFDILESPQVTNFGQFGPFENCSEGFLVTGFQLKMEAYRRRLDNTALNAVRFFCGNMIFKSLEDISSYRGVYGTYQTPQYCSTYAIGFQLMSQTYQGRRRDDVAATNFRIICADGIEIDGYNETSGYEYNNSSYTEARVCNLGQGLCGIQTQVEAPQGLADDTALNNLRVKCCQIGSGLPSTAGPPSEESPETVIDNETPSPEDQPQEHTDLTTTEVIETSTAEIIESSTTSTTEIIEPSTAEIIEPSATEIIESSTTEIIEPSATEIIESSTTEIIESSPTEIIESSTDEIIELSTAEIIELSTTDIIEPSTSEVIESSATEIIEPSTAKIIESSTTEIIEPSTTEIIELSTTEIIESSTSEVIESSATEIIESSATEIIEPSATEEALTTEKISETSTGNGTEVTETLI